ncbi:DUF3993 domain-containing protein [Bacillus seohaeanensis]|jgi:hypothetical protein|uniref:DUF3993 domain-containing protein n=1 Tax=Bacillus seohaeanensis TaxID=284580 RepID=A0ABW5RNU9_9BACI
MKVNKVILSIILFSLLTAFGHNQTSIFNKEQAITIVEKAFKTQVSLSEKPRSMQQIEKLLDGYFTEEFKKSFMKENVVGMDDGYVTLGSDFAPYYIPFFHYNETTNASYANGKWYVWEKRLGSESGPYSTPTGVEAVILVKQNGTWKVSDITYELPENVSSP